MIFSFGKQRDDFHPGDIHQAPVRDSQRRDDRQGQE
jgi:hypothetical protein